MSPRANKATKFQAVKAVDGRIHFGLSLTGESKPAVFRPRVYPQPSCMDAARILISGPSSSSKTHEEDTPMLTPAEDRNARELDQFAQAYEQMAAQPRNTLESAIALVNPESAYYFDWPANLPTDGGRKSSSLASNTLQTEVTPNEVYL